MKHSISSFCLSVLLALAVFSCLLSARAQDATRPVRLFLLTGQSNLVGLEPAETFTPMVEKAFPDDEIVVVKYAVGGRPIRAWVKDWKSNKPDDKNKGSWALYRHLVSEAEKALVGKKPDSITFVWMQGERDGREGYGQEYGDALQMLAAQLEETYGRKDIDFVLGRLSDHGVGKPEFPAWDAVRKAQVEFVEKDPAHRAWIDTDSFNESGDGLHYDKEGREKLSAGFAKESIRLIQGGWPGVQ